MKKTIMCCLACITVLKIAAAQEINSFAFADYSQGKVFVMEQDKIVWEHLANNVNDLWVLDNGNLLFTTGNGVLEVTRAKDTVFCFTSPSTVYSCKRLKNGNTFVAECSGGRLLEVSPEGKIVKQINILPEGTTDGGGGYIRNARPLDNGNYIAAHYAGQSVKEYNSKGEVVWSAEIPGGAHSVIRLPGGNTLVAVADVDQNAKILEFNKHNEVVWQFSNEDMEGDPLKFMAGMQYFPDGKLLVSNWVGHGHEGKAPHLYLIDMKTKKILWQLDQCEGIRTVSSAYVLDGNVLSRSKKTLH